MSIRFSWNDLGLDPAFSEQCRVSLESSLNSFPLPGKLIGPICVKELFPGLVPPALEMMEICTLSKTCFSAMFRFSYAGDARVVLECPVQVRME